MSLQNNLACANYDFQVDDGDDSIRLRVQRRVAAYQRDRRLRRWIRNLRLDQGGSAGRLVSHLLGTRTLHGLSFRCVSTFEKIFKNFLQLTYTDNIIQMTTISERTRFIH